MKEYQGLRFDKFLFHVIKRRSILRKCFDVKKEFSQIEETCVPSYLHSNPISATAAWLRLRAAVHLYDLYANSGAVLDFGCGSGELRFLIQDRDSYHFIDENESLVQFLKSESPGAVRERLDQLAPSTFQTIFALDALEHNNNIKEIVSILQGAMAKEGILIVSGPTENLIYKIGRKISGFSGGYHTTNIFHIEKILEGGFLRLSSQKVPFGIPLFLLSAWKLR